MSDEISFREFAGTIDDAVRREVTSPTELRSDVGDAVAAWRFRDKGARVLLDDSGTVAAIEENYEGKLSKKPIWTRKLDVKDFGVFPSPLTQRDVAAAQRLVCKISGHLDSEIGSRLLESGALVLWSWLMVLGLISSFVFGIQIDCGGVQHKGIWIWPVIVAGLFALIVVYSIIADLANNRPERVRDMFKDFARIASCHYRRAPRWWTISMILLTISLANQLFRYGLEVHAAAHYTVVHDRLLGTWQTYQWDDCPPPDDDD